MKARRTKFPGRERLTLIGLLSLGAVCTLACQSANRQGPVGSEASGPSLARPQPSPSSGVVEKAQSLEPNLQSDTGAKQRAASDAPSDAAVAPSVPSPGPSNPHPAKPLPPTVQVGARTELSVAGDRDILVYHAKADVNGAIVYLHGVCGNVDAVDPWAKQALRYGSLIILLGDTACSRQPGRFRWTSSAEQLDARIDKALHTVAAVRERAFSDTEFALFGYSQGAARAELLAETFPDKYRRILLGGPPTAPSPKHLHAVESVGVLGGEHEGKAHMKAGVKALADAGIHVKFWVFPEASHGEFGPDGPEIMADAFAWLYSG